MTEKDLGPVSPDIIEKKTVSMLSIAAKAGKVISGSETVLESIRKKEAVVVLLGSDSSERTRKVFKDKCSFYRVPVYEFGTKEGLGRTIGKEERSVVAVTDRNLGREIERLFRSGGINGEDSDT